jgi:hypothetical protein
MKLYGRLCFVVLALALVFTPAGLKALTNDPCPPGCSCQGGSPFNIDCQQVLDCDDVMHCDNFAQFCSLLCDEHCAGYSNGTYCDGAPICLATCECQYAWSC